MKFSVVMSITEEGGIGKDGNVPWRIPEDLKRFQNITKNSIVIMGRKTWESIPIHLRPLKERICIVISNKINESNFLQKEVQFTDMCYNIEKNLKWKYVEFVGCPISAIQRCKELQSYSIFQNYSVNLIGGPQCLEWFFKNSKITKIYLTVIHSKVECDVYWNYMKYIKNLENTENNKNNKNNKIMKEIILDSGITKNKVYPYQNLEWTFKEYICENRENKKNIFNFVKKNK